MNEQELAALRTRLDAASFEHMSTVWDLWDQLEAQGFFVHITFVGGIQIANDDETFTYTLDPDRLP